MLKEQMAEQAMNLERRIVLEGDAFRIYFRYEPALVVAVKALPHRGFVKGYGPSKPAHWAAPCVVDNVPAIADFAAAQGFVVDEQAAEKIRELAELKPKVEAQRLVEAKASGDEAALGAARLAQIPQIDAVPGDALEAVLIDTRGYRPELNSIIKSSGEAAWLAADKKWRLAFSRRSAAIIERLVSERGFTIADSLAERINAQLAALEEQVGLSVLADSDFHPPVPAGLAYKPFQRAGIAYAAKVGNVIIGDEPGLGKTIQAIGIANLSEQTRSVLVIAPASLKINWQREWRKWDVKSLSVGVVRGGRPENWPADANVVIINFDLVAKHAEAIHARQWDLMVVDEAHNLRNPKAKRTQLILGGGSKEEPLPAIAAKQKALLTGTPIVSRPIELWPLIHAVAPSQFSNFIAFAKRYCGAVRNGYGWDFKGASNLEELQEVLRSTCMVRRRKADVLKELPRKVRQVILIEDEKLAKAEADGVGKIRQRAQELEAAKVLAYLSDDPDGYREAVAKLKEAQKADFQEISKLRHQTALGKVPQVVDLVNEALESSKVILFAHHMDVIQVYKAAFGDAAVVVDGSTPNDQRQAAADRFQTDPECKVFIGSILAAGVGLTLTASSHVVFGELSWVPGDVSQAEDRAHRIGQQGSVLVWHTVVDGSIDARMAEVLVEKQAVIDGAMDDAIEVESVSVSGNAPAEPVAAAVESADESEQVPGEVLLPEFQTIGKGELNAWLKNTEARAAASRNRSVAERASGRAAERGFAAASKAMTPEQIEAVHRNLRELAFVCDGARERDQVGFNGPDSPVGKALAAVPVLNPLQAAYAREMLAKYVKQLGREALDAMWDKADGADQAAAGVAGEGDALEAVALEVPVPADQQGDKGRRVPRMGQGR